MNLIKACKNPEELGMLLLFFLIVLIVLFTAYDCSELMMMIFLSSCFLKDFAILGNVLLKVYWNALWIKSVRLKDGVPAAHHDWGAKETKWQKQERLQPGKTPVDMISIQVVCGLNNAAAVCFCTRPCNTPAPRLWYSFDCISNNRLKSQVQMYGNCFSRAKSHSPAHIRFESVVFKCVL